jgi:hypothetical protein
MNLLKIKKMKKIILFAFLVIFSLCAFAITPDSKSKSENPAIPEKKENKMSEEEINSLTRSAEKISEMDKSQQGIVVQEGRRTRRGHQGMNGDHRRNGTVVFVGGASTLLLIILIIILI